jgi:site-specific DNA recombinase
MNAGEWTEIAEVYTDAGVSGTTRDRPALQRLLADARAGKIGRVVCTKLDRMGRRAADILAIEDELDSYGVERTYINDAIDTSTHTGRLLRTVLAAVAELERDMIVERTKAGAVEKARRGGITRPRSVYGYRIAEVNSLTGAKGGLELDPETAAVVRRIFEAIAAGVSSNELARILTMEHVPTPRGAKVWWETTIRKIVRNPIYTGKATYGRLKNVKYKDENGRTKMRAVTNDPNKVIYIDAPAIVSEELAVAAQHQLTQNFQLSPRNTCREYLLGGGHLLYCGVCAQAGKAYTMRGYAVHGQFRRYRCTVMQETGRKTMHSVAAGPVEQAVWTTLAEALRDPSRLLADATALADSNTEQARAGGRARPAPEGSWRAGPRNRSVARPVPEAAPQRGPVRGQGSRAPGAAPGSGAPDRWVGGAP